MASTRIENLPLEWVRSFEAAGRNGSFTSAAEEMNLTQAAVSQRIGNLENHIGAQLFIRQPRGVTLTIAGEAWLPHVTQALFSLKQSAEELFASPLERIIISSSASINQLWITPRLENFKSSANLQISLSTMNIEQDFAKAHPTIEIKYGSGNWHEKMCAQLFQEEMAPLAAPCLLKTSKHWQDLPIIAVSGPRPGWQEWAAKNKENAPLLPKYRYDSYVMAQTAALAGLGVILGSLPLSQPFLKNGALLRLTKPTLKTKSGYWMMSNHKRLLDKQWDQIVTSLIT